MANQSQHDAGGEPRASALAGMAVLLGMFTGLAGLVMAVVCSINSNRTSAAYCLIAAALAFGLLANAMLRK